MPSRSRRPVLTAVFLVHLAATLALAGLIWTVQRVHYPLFAGVGADGWAAYEAAHQARITPVVGPLMVAELGTAVWLVLAQPEGLPAGALLVGAALVGVVWGSTLLVQAPLHRALGGAFDGRAHARLVATNWVRTVAWTARAALVVWWTARLLPDLG